MTEVKHGAVGKVCTGYSLPWVARYSATAGTLEYTNGMRLARGVSVDIQPGESSAQTFYADNQSAESGKQRFTNGTLTQVVDGLLSDAARMINGLPEFADDGFIHEGDSVEDVYCGTGFVCRYLSGGVESFQPVILLKVKYNKQSISAETEGESINFQTQSLTANIFRADNANHDWRLRGKDYSTEAEAEAEIKKFFRVK